MMQIENQKIGTDDETKEMVYYYNEMHQKLGITTRKEAIQKGYLIDAAHLWIINPITKQVLLQKRASKRIHDKNMIDISVGAHVRAGEIPSLCILREAEEEIALPRELLQRTIKPIMQMRADLRKYGRDGNYLVYEYVAFINKPLEEFHRQKEEIAKLFFMDYEEFKAFVRSKDSRSRIPYEKETEILFQKIEEKWKEKEEEQER